MAKKWKLAILDTDGLLTGYKRCAKKAWTTTKTQVAVPEECALEPGRYRWDGTTFVPLPPKGGEDALVQDSDAMMAIAKGFLALAEGNPVPTETADWASKYMRSIDAILRGPRK